MKADEALRITLKEREDHNNEYEEIIKAIEKSAMRGHDSLTLNVGLSHITMARLKEDGFRVGYHFILWSKESQL